MYKLSPVTKTHTMKIFLLVVSTSLMFISCAQNSKGPPPESSSYVVPKPESKEIRAGEKVNMMMLMEAESQAYDLDEVIVIPPKNKKEQP